MTKKVPPSPALTPQSEALVVQQALAFYRDVKRNAKNAPIGQFINCAEAMGKLLDTSKIVQKYFYAPLNDNLQTA